MVHILNLLFMNPWFTSLSKKGQEWRLDTKYIADRNLKPKYVWLEYGSVKVYLQLDRVKYADYKPNYFYISIHEFDDATV